MMRFLKLAMVAVGFFIAACVIIVITYVVALNDFEDGMFDPLMVLAQDLCSETGGSIVAIPMARGQSAECLTEDEANERGFAPDPSGIYRDIILPEPPDFGEIVGPEQ